MDEDGEERVERKCEKREKVKVRMLSQMKWVRLNEVEFWLMSWISEVVSCQE